MDNRGYIFSTDAVLALVIFFVIAGSILTYYTLPSYLGADHQHLEAEADSALALLTNDGDLHAAILKINSNDTKKQEEGKQLLNDKLRLILPSDVAYDLEVSGVSISDNKGINDPNDRVSRYTVISAPEEGWLGRAWYKVEDVQFKKEYVNTTQTLWNFHNFIRGFEYWKSNNLGTAKGKYWGKPSSEISGPISFTIPDGANLKGAYYIVGCQGSNAKIGTVYNITQFNGKQTGLKDNNWQTKWHPLNGDWNNLNNVWISSNFYLLPDLLPGSSTNRESNKPVQGTAIPITVNENNHPELNAKPSFGVKLYFNDNEGAFAFGNISGYPNGFNYLFRKDNNDGSNAVFNGKGNIDVSFLKPGDVNNFYMEFIGANSDHNMPWFSLLGEYSMSIVVPEGINTDRFPKESESKNYYCAGAGMKGQHITYDLNTGAINKFRGTREIKLKDYRGHNSTQNGVNYANGIPFRLDPTGTKGIDGKEIKDGSAVSREYPIDLTEEGNNKINSKNIRIVDAYAVVNTYAATDKVLVEVYNGSDWHEVFDSLKNSKVESGGGGYGNTPGTVYIPTEYLAPNHVNKLRVTVWDDAGGSGYDLVGLVDTYAVVSFTSLPIKWEPFPFVSQQSKANINGPNNQTLSQTQTFSLGTDPDASKVMFFFGVGLDTNHVKLEVSKDNSTWKTLYAGNEIPFALDIGDIDVANDPLFTRGSVGNYSTIDGVYYARLTVNVGEGWKSGDEQKSGDSYRKLTSSAACEIFSGSRLAVIYPKFLSNEWTTEYADTADNAKIKATERLIAELNSTIDPNLINTEALYAGDMPNTVPIRLDLWRS